MIEKNKYPHTKTDTKRVCFLIEEGMWKDEIKMVQKSFDHGYDTLFYFGNWF